MKKKTMLAVFLAFSLTCTATACGGQSSGKESGQSSENIQSESIYTSEESESVAESVKPIIPEEITYETYGSYWFSQHDYKTMPIGTYNSCPPKQGEYTQNFLESEELFRSYKEAGVNTMMGLSDYVGTNTNSVLTALDYCYDYDFAYLLAYAGANDVRSESTVKSTLAKVMYHDNFAGIMLVDEPGRVMYESMATSRSIFEKVLKDTSEKLYHVNLFPTYANQKQLWFRTYTENSVVPDSSYNYQKYVDDYIEIYNPQVLSYDFYPITGRFPTLSNGYFENMSIIKRAAERENIPFWTFIQTCSFRNGQRLPTEADLLWNVNTCLAYGAKGIQYFCGVNPNNGGEVFNGSMFDRSGNRTEVYDRVKKANMQIKAIDEVLMCSISKGVMLVGNMPLLKSSSTSRMSIPQEDLIENYGKLLSAEGSHLLIGCFDYNGKTALYVVNNAIADESAEITANCKAKLNFTESVNGYFIKETAKTEFDGETLEFDLSAGEGVLVVVD